MKNKNSDENKLNDDINKILDHASMKIHITDHAAEHLHLNVSHSVLFSELHFSIILLSYQFNEVLIMREQKQLSFDAIIYNKSVLQTDILTDNMNLKKIIEILALTYIVY